MPEEKRGIGAVTCFWLLTHKSNESTQHCFEPRITHSNSNHGLWSRPNMLGYVQYPLLNINEVMNCDVEPCA